MAGNKFHLASVVLGLLLVLERHLSLAFQDQIIAWEDMEEEVNEMTQYREHCSSELAQCYHNGTRRHQNKSDLPIFCRQCDCDDDCIRFGDCCLDKTQTEWGDGREEGSGRYNCRKIVSSSSVGILMIDSCLPSWSGRPEERMCQQNVSHTAYTYVLDVPVTSRLTNITYINYYCALCNNDALELHNLTININCTTKEILNEFSMVDFMREAIYSPGTRSWTRNTYRDEEDALKGILLASHRCELEIKEFRNITEFPKEFGSRPCIYPKSLSIGAEPSGRTAAEQVRQCHPDWPDRTDVEKCKRYSLLVKYRDSEDRETYYKNPHCAKCNFANVTSYGDWQCFEPSLHCRRSMVYGKLPPLPLCFSVLMDFRGHGCNRATELWDPIHEMCQQIECGRLFRLVRGRCERDPEAYAPLANSTLLEVACMTRLLNVTEYVPRDDGSVFVNESKKVLKRGEFEATNDSRILVCVDISHYTDGAFSKAHQYLTLVVLCVSLAALGLHIIIFVLVPRHRNLPGKNLFSLSCCLFVAHVLFLTGTQKTDTYGLCVFLSCSLHYSWLAAFCWMNVMSVDVCRTFTSHVYRSDADGASTFLLYSLYAWTTPAVVVALALALDFGNILSEYRPDYATRTCWINNRNGLALFFLLPVGAVVLENIVLFCVSACCIYKQAKAARYVNKRSQSVMERCKDRTGKKAKKDVFSDPSAQNRRSKKHRVRLLLYVKLGVMQGLSWVTGFIAAFADIPACWYAFTVLNGLQGAFIFIGFDLKSKVAVTLWESVTGRPWKTTTSKDKTLSKDTRTTENTTTTKNTCNQNRSSKSYSDSDGERLEVSHISTGQEDTPNWGSTVRLTSTQVAPKISSKLAKNPKVSAQPSASNSPKTGQKSSSVCPERVRNGDLRGGVVRGKFDDEFPERSFSRRRPKSSPEDELKTNTLPLPDAPLPLQESPRPDLQRVMELLQQLKESKKNSVDLPDLVQQLLLRSATNVVQNKAKLSKCRSFTEGADPGLQEDQHSALAARLKLLEYSKECPTIHNLITSHTQMPLVDARYQKEAGPQATANTTGSSSAAGSIHQEALGASPSCSPGPVRRRPAPLNRTASTSMRSINRTQSVKQEKRQEFGSTKAQSFSQISHVALAAAIMHRAATDAREKRRRLENQPPPADDLPNPRASFKNTAESLV